jgi:hypothetical protein
MSAPEGEVTAAVERLAKAQFRAYESEYSADGVTVADFYATARADLAAALDVEEMARIISSHRHGSQVAWDEDRRTAAALRAAILGEES